MKRSRLSILALLVVLTIEAVAQNDAILVQNKDSVAYRYTPITVPTTNPRMRKWRDAFVRYITDSATDNSFDKAIDFSVVPTIYYAPSTSLGLAVVANGLYRLDKSDRTLQPSTLSIFATASITGFYRVGVSGNNIFRGDNQRILYNAEFYSQPVAFWGVGYHSAMSNAQLNYLASRTIVEGRFLQRVVDELYVGVGVDFNYHFGNFTKRIGKGSYSSKAELLARLDGQGVDYNATGISLFAEYDRRDAISSPQRGFYLALEGKVRPKGMSNIGRTLWMARLTANYYQPLWRGAILAFDLQGEYNSAGTPWVYNANCSLRGYYAGRFNDLCAITLQAELRQTFFERFGVVAWGGAGNLFHDFRSFEWGSTLPTYGVGVRYIVKRGVTLRFDYGFGSRDHRGKLIHGAVFSLNEAF